MLIAFELGGGPFDGPLFQTTFIPLGEFREGGHPIGDVTSTLFHRIDHTK